MHCKYKDNSTWGTRLRKIRIYTFRVNPNGHFLNLAKGSMMIFHFCHSWHCSAHKIQGFVFPTSLWPHYSTTADTNPGKLGFCWPVWAVCPSPVLCTNIQNGKRRNKIPLHMSLAKEAKHRFTLLLCLVLWFSKSERVPALGFTHCIESKTLVTSEHPYRSFS